MQLGTADTLLTIAAQEILNPGGAAQWLLLKAAVTNNDVSAHTATLYRVPSGGTAGSTNILAQSGSVQPGETVAFAVSAQSIMDGATLSAAASVDSQLLLSLTYAVVPSS